MCGSRYKDKPSLIAAIQSVQYRGGNTATSEGLRFARSYHLTTSHGARINASHVVIVLTDGRSTDVSQTIAEAQILKDNKIEVISIGVGASVNPYELDHMATDRNHVFTVGSFDILHTILDEIRDQSCERKIATNIVLKTKK